MSEIDEYRNQIIVGDSLELLRTLPDESVPMFFFSPPYNLGVSNSKGKEVKRTIARKGRNNPKWRDPALANGYQAHDDALSYADYIKWQKEVLLECYRALRADGAIYYQHKPRVQNGLLQNPLDLNPKLPLRQIIIWARAGGLNFNQSSYASMHEWIIIFCKPQFRLKSQGASGVGDVWYVPQESNTWHPAPFPIKLATMALETVMPSLVVDPFMGSGTTAKAAVKLGIDYIGFELSPTYAERARKEIAEIEAQPRLIPLEATQEKMAII